MKSNERLCMLDGWMAHGTMLGKVNYSGFATFASSTVYLAGSCVCRVLRVAIGRDTPKYEQRERERERGSEKGSNQK
jgi:hypothetical protein